MEKEYDAIVIDAGLGGLVCGATLASEYSSYGDSN